MLYKNCLFLTAVFVSACVLVHSAVAVPTVRKLGNSANNNVHNNIQPSRLQSKKSYLPGKRGPSVRVLGTAAKATTKPVSNVKTVKTVSKTAGSADSSRLSGLHGNIVKGISSKLSQSQTPQPSGIDTSNLEQRVNLLEEKIITKSGDGLIIDGNKITLSEEMKELPEQMAEITQKVEDLSAEFDTDNYYTIEQTNAYVQQIVSQLNQANIVDHFDPGFLTGNKGQ
jgi:hypothetical protein